MLWWESLVMGFFVLRDPAGIRPTFYYQDDEVLVVASERPVIQTAFNVPLDAVKELERGHALIAKKSGEIKIEKILEPLEKNLVLSKEFIFLEVQMQTSIEKEKI